MKQKTVYVCQECGAQSQKWLGRCPDCGAWNSLVEERPVPMVAGGGAAAASAGARYSLAATAGCLPPENPSRRDDDPGPLARGSAGARAARLRCGISASVGGSI